MVESTNFADSMLATSASSVDGGFGASASAAARLADLLPDDAGMAEVVRVVDFPLVDGRRLLLTASGLRQEVLCWLQGPGERGS